MTNTSQCEDLYEAQLTNITERLVALDADLIYITTTPFMPKRLLNNTVVEDMNTIARRVVAQHNITVLDLYETVAKICGPIPYSDCSICRVHPCSYHYNNDGENLQAGIISTAINQTLQARHERHHARPVAIAK